MNSHYIRTCSGPTIEQPIWKSATSRGCIVYYHQQQAEDLLELHEARLPRHRNEVKTKLNVRDYALNSRVVFRSARSDNMESQSEKKGDKSEMPFIFMYNKHVVFRL